MDWWRYGPSGQPTPRIPDKTRIPLVALGKDDGREVHYMGPVMRMPKPQPIPVAYKLPLDEIPPYTTFETLEFRIHLWRPCWSAAPSPRYVQRELEPTYV